MPTATTLESSSSTSLGRFDRFSDNHPVAAQKDSRKQHQIGDSRYETMEKISQQHQHKGHATTGDRTDQPPLLPMRQMTHSDLSCVTENSNSDRFTLSERDEAILAPRRQISKSFSDRLLRLSCRSAAPTAVTCQPSQSDPQSMINHFHANSIKNFLHCLKRTRIGPSFEVVDGQSKYNDDS